MSGGNMFLAIVLLVIFGAVVYGIYRIQRSIRRISRLAFGTDSFLEGLEQQEDMLAETPKTVAGMTNLCLPRIQKDFPEFHWPEWRQRCETTLKTYLQAVGQRSPALLQEVSEELRRQAELEIDEQKQLDELASYALEGEECQLSGGKNGGLSGGKNGGLSGGKNGGLSGGKTGGESGGRSYGVRRGYEQVKIHRTEITRYQKEPGMRVIAIQSAVGYRSRFEERKIQTRFNMELVYVQDITKIKDAATAIGAVCPNCGAPITELGNKVCHYCGSAVESVNERVWKLHRIEEERG